PRTCLYLNARVTTKTSGFAERFGPRAFVQNSLKDWNRSVCVSIPIPSPVSRLEEAVNHHVASRPNLIDFFGDVGTCDELAVRSCGNTACTPQNDDTTCCRAGSRGSSRGDLGCFSQRAVERCAGAQSYFGDRSGDRPASYFSGARRYPDASG